LQNDFISVEQTLNESNRRMLSATEARYGPNSSEYEQAAARAGANAKANV